MVRQNDGAVCVIGPRGIARYLLALLSLIGVCSRGDGRACASDRPPDMQTIREAVNRNAAALTTLQGKYRWTPTANEDPRPDGIRRQGAQGEIEFEVDLVLGKIRLDERWIYDHPGKNGGRVEMCVHTLETFDGSKGYSLDYVRDDGPADPEHSTDMPLSLKVTTAPPRRFSMYPWEFTERYVRGMGLNLTDLFRMVEVKSDGADEIDGVQCPRLPVDELGLPFVIWIDPDHDSLPKRRGPRKFPTGGTGRIPAEQLDSRGNYEVFEFARFRDLATGNDCWFPLRMRARDSVKTVDLDVVELQINPTIDPGRFVISPEELPDGVRITESVSFGQTPSSYTGDRQDLWEEHERLSSAEGLKTELLIDWTTPPSPPPAGVEVLAESILPAVIKWFLTAGGCLAALFLVTVCVWVWRSKRRHAE
jgi:hypothetical protein